jgi:methionyl-tRNA synthetase
MSAGLQIPKTLFVHGYFTVNGQKMSKTVGNIIDPNIMINTYGTDALRFYFLREIPAYSDGDFSERRLKEIYNSDLANGLGNLVARIARLAENSKFKFQSASWRTNPQFKTQNYPEYTKLFSEFRFNEVIELIWSKVTEQNQYIDDNKPWKLEGQELEKVLKISIEKILEIAYLLQPMMPETSEIIITQLTAKKIVSQPPMFPRIK